jgi:hypothetical protein
MSELQRDSMGELAGKLEKTARSITFIHIGVWAIGGTALGVALGGDTRGGQLAGAAGYALIGGIVGWWVGQGRAAALRLQAVTTHRRTEPQ